jgi:uncharacterized membrane protein
MKEKGPRNHGNLIMVLVFTLLSLALLLLPTGFEERISGNAERVRGKVLAVDNTHVQELGMVRTGDQKVNLRIEQGRFKGQTVTGNNPLLGMMDRDKLFAPGDSALVVLTLDSEGAITFVNPQEHYRLGPGLMLLSAFALLLVCFGGWTGIRALLSFLFTALVLWKVLVPCLLKGYDPIWLTLGIVALLTAVIIFLVAGINRRGLVAFLGAFSGLLISCSLAAWFADSLHLHGAIMPFAETLLYAGYAHLDLTRIFVAAVFLAASGAVMDLAMDVSVSLHEIVEKKPKIGFREALGSGIRVGRAVVGTMTTTLLFAYSGGYITLLMAFMAQGVPLANTANLIYVSAEVLKTLAGSFGLVTAAPLTALIGAAVYTRSGGRFRSMVPGFLKPRPGMKVTQSG